MQSGRKGKVNDELSEVQPMIDAAKEAVNDIKKEHLNEIRSLKMPPEPIRDVLEGVLRLMGNYDTSWISMKRFLSQTGVKDSIINFDVRSITPSIRNSVVQLLDEHASSFDQKVIGSVFRHGHCTGVRLL